MRAMASALPLRLEGLGYAARGETLLAGVDLTFPQGGLTAVLGPNGAGKSLLLRLCHGLLAPSAGRIIWADPGRAAQAMVFQRPVLLRRTLAGNLDHALALRGLPRGVRRARAGEAMARFGLVALAARPARLLSGGEQQRLALARAWTLRPEVMFLDEPSSHLDPAAARAIEAMVLAFKAEGMTIVMSTHDLGQARRLADRVALLHRGRLVESGPAEEFFSRPETAEGRAFVRGDLLW